jgi:hypothetical protein
MGKTLAIISVFFITTAAQAAMITYTTPSGSSANGETVSASAVFNVTDANHFTITLNNTIGSALHSAGQLLSDLEFNVTAANLTMTSSNGQVVTINDNGSTTPGANVSTGWGFGSTGGNSFLLCIICGSGVSASGAQPAHTIIPTGSSFSNANNSIAGNGPHNPFLASGATFNFSTTSTLNTAGNPFSGVIFSFGTEFGNNVSSPGPGTSTPEPATYLISGAGLIALAVIRRRRAA